MKKGLRDGNAEESTYRGRTKRLHALTVWTKTMRSLPPHGFLVLSVQENVRTVP